MDKSKLFTEAHKIAKNTVSILGSYVVALSAALRQLWAQLRKPTVKSVRVEWSESGAFNDNTEYSVENYNWLAKLAEEEHKTGGYLKTKVTVIYSNGVEYALRHDIGCDNADITLRVEEAALNALSDDCPAFMKPSEDLKAFYLSIV